MPPIVPPFARYPYQNNFALFSPSLTCRLPSFCITCARREHSWTLPLSAVTKGLQVALHRQQEPQGVLHPQQQVPKEKGMWGKALRVR